MSVSSVFQGGEQTGLFLSTGVKIKLCHASPTGKGPKSLQRTSTQFIIFGGGRGSQNWFLWTETQPLLPENVFLS